MTAGTGKARVLLRALPLVVLDVAATGIAYVTAAYGVAWTAGRKTALVLHSTVHGCIARVVL